MTHPRLAVVGVLTGVGAGRAGADSLRCPEPLPFVDRSARKRRRSTSLMSSSNGTARRWRAAYTSDAISTFGTVYSLPSQGGLPHDDCSTPSRWMSTRDTPRQL